MRRTAAAAGVAAALAGLAGAPAALAAPAGGAGQSPVGPSIAVSPTRVLVTAGAGPLRQTFRVENMSVKPVTVTGTIRQGHQLPSGPSIFTSPGPDSGAAWLTVRPDRLTLAAGQTRTVIVLIRVPARHSPGQRYLAVLFAALPAVTTAHGAGAMVSVGIDAELIVNVSGHVRHGVKIGPLTAPAVSFGGPVPLKLTYRNTGNVLSLDNHLTARAGTASIRFPGVLALGGSTRIVSTSWTDPPAWCFPCRITTAGGTASVWRIDPAPVIAVLLIAAGITMAVLGRRAYHAAAASGSHAAERALAETDRAP